MQCGGETFFGNQSRRLNEAPAAIRGWGVDEGFYRRQHGSHDADFRGIASKRDDLFRKLVRPAEHEAGAPDHFDLIDLKHGEAFACRVVWRRYPMIGVTFDARDRLDTAESPRLKSLKSLWLAAVNRG